MFHGDGSPKFKYIVEGANLFFTGEARLILEEAGVKLFKDASTNKGGVTSSSMEVFASLALEDNVHTEQMTVPAGSKTVPAFYDKYAKNIVQVVNRNARSEFDVLWPMVHNQGKSSPEMTDLLSAKINQLTDEMFKKLVADQPEGTTELKRTDMVDKILKQALPESLFELTTMDRICANAPRNYLLAMCATTVAFQYVYSSGLDASEFNFFQFMQSFLNK